MLGPSKSRRLDAPITVSLEDLLPANNFYRHVEAKLDLGFVREWAHELYADRGRPSIDPVVFFKLQLVMFFEDIRSERKLIETASLNLAHRWYLGYALDEALPDHSSLTRIRQRLGIDVFQRFFEKIVDVGLEDVGIHAYVPLPDMNRRRPFYGQDDFAFDAVGDVYRCLAGHVLARERVKHTEGEILYRANPTACNACPLKAECTESRRGRIVHRSLHAEYLDKVRSYHATEAYKKAMRKRQVWVEPLFAEAKVWHGLRRFRLRGLENVNIEGLLVAAGQNLKRFLAATGWGRCHAPCGSLVAPLRELRRLSAVCS